MPEYRTDGETRRYRSAHPSTCLRASARSPQPSPLKLLKVVRHSNLECTSIPHLLSIFNILSLLSFIFDLSCHFDHNHVHKLVLVSTPLVSSEIFMTWRGSKAQYSPQYSVTEDSKTISQDFKLPLFHGVHQDTSSTSHI